MCWGAIGWGWKGPFFIWLAETKQEKEEAKQKVLEYNGRCKEEEDRLNLAWRNSSEWRELREWELQAAQEARKTAKDTGKKVKTKQT